MTKSAWTKVLILAVILVIGVVTYCVALNSVLAAADEQTTTAWIMCSPDGYVNCRLTPSTRGDVIGYLETGYRLEIDGKTKNGYAHCVDMSLEYSTGWVHCGFIVFEEPKWWDKDMTITASGRVACRKWADGERINWVIDGSTVHVYWTSDNWAITNKGWIQTQYLAEVI